MSPAERRTTLRRLSDWELVRFWELGGYLPADLQVKAERLSKERTHEHEVKKWEAKSTATKQGRTDAI